jgi:hypothetical protein
MYDSPVVGCPRYRVMPLGLEDDLAVGVAAFELAIGLADLRERVDVRDRHLKGSLGDQADQLGEHLGPRPGLPVSLHAVFLSGRVIGDGVDPVGRDAKGEGQLDVPAWASIKASTPLGTEMRR